MSEASIETEIKAKGADVAPRITPEHIDNAIAAETFIQWPDQDAPIKCLTICVLTMRNGFTIVGHGACASPENFNAELGRKIAREDARRQIWALEGYQLRTKLAGG